MEMERCGGRRTLWQVEPMPLGDRLDVRGRNGEARMLPGFLRR